ncbi:hypothetical protein [Butyrivibrio sp. VCD2006]|uniref:hypothetical protein n=1 Tax=Butyrivibrio sp. VCD2006 TaxID=1280664 RepID=UPI00041E6E5B|nr:hypothetical protein [Butyrivibrio sp. VCD2006]
MKNKKRLAGFVAGIMLAGIMLCACGKASTFDGSKTGDADQFNLDFETLNTEYSHELEMKEGEKIDVSVERLKGKIAITIQKGDEEPAYRGSDVETSDFQVGIGEEGTYTLTVSGKDAKGHVYLKRKD